MEIVHSGTVLSNAAPGQCCWDCVNHFSNRQKLKIESLRISITRKSLAAGETSQKLIFDIFIVALFKHACKIISQPI